MPLTFAHPVAAVPFTRLGLPLSALVVGSMSPDFVYFLRLRPGGEFGHTVPGLLLSDLPASLLVLWVFHRWLARPLLELAPRAVQERLAPVAGRFAFGPPSRWLRIVLAVLLGAATHVLWDGFTHGNGWAVERWPGLREPVGLGSLGDVRLFKLLQHGSSLAGLLALAALGAWWLRRTPPVARVSPRLPSAVRLRRVLALAGGGLAFGLAYAWLSTPEDPDFLRLFAGRAIVAGTTGACLLALGYGVRMERAAGV